MPRPLLIVGLTLLTVLGSAPAALGAWSVPEADPYEADKRVVVDEVADRRNLVYADGLLVWVQRAANNTTVETEPGAVPQIALLSVSEDEGASGNVTVPSNHPADGPSVSEGYVAWRAHPGGHDREGDDAEIRVLDRDTGEVRTMSPAEGRTAEPVLDGEDVYWLTYNLSDENRTIHRVNLTTGERSSWPSPMDWNTRGLGIAGETMLLSSGERLVAWVPGESEMRRITNEKIMYASGVDHVVTVEYREDDGGRGASLYLHNVSSGEERRLTFSEGRETDPSISGSLVAWADARNDTRHDRGRTGPWYDVYFQDLRTRNEYKVEGAQGITAMPQLAGERVYYGDNQGHLVEAELPSQEERLVSNAESTIQESGNHTQRLDVTLNGSGEHTVAWDTDADGTFETDGNLTVEISEGNMTPNETVQGVAVDADGRYVVVTVDTGTAYQMAMDTANQTTETDQTAPPERNETTDPGPGDLDPNEPTRQEDTARSNTSVSSDPVPGPELGVLLALATAAVATVQRRR